jgi:Ca-activated chloride channel family protein
LLQFLYGLDFGKAKKIKDVVFLIDTSESMLKTDPGNERYLAAQNLINSMNNDNRTAIYVFNDEIKNIQPMAYVDSNLKGQVVNELKQLEQPSGKTNLKGALDTAMEQIISTQSKDRSTMVIALTDGMDNYNLQDTFDKTINPYRNSGIPVYTIGMNENLDELLGKIADETDGIYYNVKETQSLKNLFNKIYLERDRRLLVDKRNGSANDNILFALLRVLFLTIIGGLIGLGGGLIFDNKYISKSFGIAGLLSGFISGLILELGFGNVSYNAPLLRLWADIVLSVIYTFFTFIFGVGAENQYYGEQGYLLNRRRDANTKNNYKKSTF